MSHWPLGLGRPSTAVALPRTNSAPTTVTATASATVNTKGAWVELAASTSADATMMVLTPSGTGETGTAHSVLCDIGIGAAGAEVVILSNLLIGMLENAVAPSLALPLPFAIPAGSRVAARIQSNVASKTATMSMDLYGAEDWPGMPSLSAVTTYGADPATSKGMVVQAAALNAKGTWVDVAAATSRPHPGLILLVQGNQRLVDTAESWLFDVGLWNGTTYDVIWADHPVRYSVNETVFYRSLTPMMPTEARIPHGSRLGVRMASTNNLASADVALYGLT